MDQHRSDDIHFHSDPAPEVFSVIYNDFALQLYDRQCMWKCFFATGVQNAWLKTN